MRIEYQYFLLRKYQGSGKGELDFLNILVLKLTFREGLNRLVAENAYEGLF